MNASLNALRVGASQGQLWLTGDGACQRVAVGATGFFRSLPRLPSPRVIDLVMIAVGAYTADRIVMRHGRRSAGGGVRSFHICTEVHDPEFWSRSEILDQVVDVLTFLTDDNWSFSFERSRDNWHQAIVPIDWFHPNRVGLFSEGLDSAAGLVSASLKHRDRTLLVTVGHYAALRRRVERQLTGLKELMPEINAHSASLLVSLRGGVARRLALQEKSQRSRAFLFCSAGIAAAESCGVAGIDVYENGAGAINLPVTMGMLTGGLATRGAHPTLLRKMSALGSEVSSAPIGFRLPNILVTKGELLSGLRGLGLDKWLAQSRSCIHTSPRIVGAPHCGFCPACLERRTAFDVGGIDDTSQYQIDIFRENLPELARLYFDAQFDHCAETLMSAPSLRRRFEAHCDITDLPVEERGEIDNLLRRNAGEVLGTFRGVRQRSIKQDVETTEDQHSSFKPERYSP